MSCCCQVAVAATNHDVPDAAAAAAEYAASMSVAKNALGALNINPRPVIEDASAPENVVQCIEHRPVPVTSPSATPVDTPLYPLRLEKAHCQVSETPTPASRSNSFIDLNPSPLPSPDCIAKRLLDIASSPYSKVILVNFWHLHFFLTNKMKVQSIL